MGQVGGGNVTSSVPVGPHQASPLVQGASSHQPPGPSVPPCVCGGVGSLVAVSSVPSCLRLQSSSPLLPARLPRGRGARGGLQPGSTSETVAPACRIPVGDEARGPSPSGSRPGCADGRHPSCRSTQPLHSDPDAGALGCLWRFPARAAHERQLWTDPRRAFGGSGREVCTLEVARGAAELAQRNRLSEAFQGAAPVGTPTPARARPETWGSRCLCGKFICS